ncbi:PorV/PorQ family protein [bacterium]|nr:MAG: PorV/PorQ family protein [bacterium]
MKQRFAGIILVLSLLFSSPVLAQIGSSGMAFLKLGVSGRGVSMGDAMSALVEGAAATYYNPAGLLPSSTGSMGTELMFMHKEWIQDSRTEFLGGAMPLGERSALGVSVVSTTVSDIEVHTRPGPAEATFTARNFSAGLSYAQAFGTNIRLGVTAKFLYEKILVDEASGYAVDLGAQMRTPVENLTAGIALANLGSMSRLESEKTSLPAMLRVGPAYSFAFAADEYRLNLAVDYLNIFPEKHSYVNTGAEFMFGSILAARGGYQFGSEGRGLSAGLGVRYGIVGLDYAYSRLAQDLGNTHTLSLAVTF